MSQRRRVDGEVWFALEVRAPRWTVWCIAVGGLLLASSSVATVVVVAVAL
ncbi:hypothetical protein [Micromonospora sp. NPDC005206]